MSRVEPGGGVPRTGQCGRALADTNEPAYARRYLAGSRRHDAVLGGITMPNSAQRHRVVVVGAGFAGYHAVRELSRLAGSSTEITLINSTDYFLYTPLLPQVSAGLVDPRHICVSLLCRTPQVRFVLGTVTSADIGQKLVTWSSPEGGFGQTGFD